ncbi:MAG: class I tRNA ligase family protein, partial [Synechococcaceae cyanobacterium]
KAPPEKDLEWDDADVEGQFRFLQRLWRLADHASNQGLNLSEPSVAGLQGSPGATTDPERQLRRAVHTAISAISEDLDGDYQFNTAVSELMKLSNAMGSLLDQVSAPVALEALSVLLLLLAPFAPHLAEELWQQLGANPSGDRSIHQQSWPRLDTTALARDSVTVVIQVKGKVRGSLEVAADLDAAELERLVLQSEVASRWLEGKPPSRVIVVPGKLVNLVP